jgi:1-acyl-sn-glycerol-3-phosphate acyltransferase
MTEDEPLPEGQDAEMACGREPLVDAISAFLAHEHTSGVGEIRRSLERLIDDAGPDAIRSLSRRLAENGTDWAYYPRDPLVRRIHRSLARPVLQHEPVVIGAEHLDTVADQPVVMFSNHLSYSDANVVDVVLEQVAGSRLSDRLTVVAGPKVFSNLKRRFSSLSFGTIKTPQNSGRSTGEAVMNPREVAQAARLTIQIAQEHLRLGEALLVFGEGTRSRSGRMQPLLPGAARYVESSDAWVLPLGIAGTELLFPIGEESVNAVAIKFAVGRPVPARNLVTRARGNRRLIMDCIGIAIAELLPQEYRGVYEDKNLHQAARSLYDRVF